MKRIYIFCLISAIFMTALPAFTQQVADTPDLILLDDATPAIDVVISLPPDTTGAIGLQLTSAIVELRDANDNIIFYSADDRLRGLELNITPNSGVHTLTVKRLSEDVNSYVTVSTLADLTIQGTPQYTDSTNLNLNQEKDFTLNNTNPSGITNITIPSNDLGIVTTTFPNISAITQLVDNTGRVLAQTADGHINGMTFVLEEGTYEFTLLGNNLTEPAIAGVRVISANEIGYVAITPPTAPETQTVANTTSNCQGVVNVSSVNLRSGPGTGYSVLNYAYRNDVMAVGGQNLESNWLVVRTSDGNSAWISRSLTNLEGSCNDLAVFDIPFRDAPPAQVIIQTAVPETIVTYTNPPAQPQAQSQPSSSNNNYRDDDHDDDDHDDDDDDHDDDDHDDDDDDDDD